MPREKQKSRLPQSFLASVDAALSRQRGHLKVLAAKTTVAATIDGRKTTAGRCTEVGGAGKGPTTAAHRTIVSP